MTNTSCEKGPGPSFAFAVGRGTVVCWLLASLYGCQLIGRGAPGRADVGPGEEAPAGGAVYQGVLTLDGGDLTAALQLTSLGRREVRANLQTSSGLLADGQGITRGDNLLLDLTYQGECPGRMILEGAWNQEDQIYEGQVQAEDCTGKGTGTFRFSAS